MKKKFLLLAYVFYAALVGINAQQINTGSGFCSPVDIPILLSGSYGELRSTHFHAGIDIKTQQTEGKNVLAAADGYIYRIVVQTDGYGKALYLRHPGGKITVYGHLSMFMPAVEAYVKENQYRRKSFELDLYPEAGKFSYKCGERIGLSGNTGSSGGPHLHFEVRDRSGSLPLNPLNYGFAVADKTKPRISGLFIYNLGVSDRSKTVIAKTDLAVKGNNGHYRLANDTVNISGTIGIGIESYDYFDQSANECGPYTIQFSIDGKPYFLCRFDSIPFGSGSYVNSHVDYAERMTSGRKVQKLFLDPNNRLGIYKLAKNGGVLHFSDNQAHHISIRVTDTYGNESLLAFYLRWADNGQQPSQGSLLAPGVTFGYDRENVYEEAGIRVVVPRDALFGDVLFSYARAENDSFPYSGVHKVHNLYTPLLRPYILSIRPEGIPENYASKALIASRGPKGTWISQGGELKNDYVTARVKLFGDFIVTLDTLPPDIVPVRFSAGAGYAANDLLTFSIADSLSGIRKYAGYIDKNWALFEYDAKNNLLSYAIDPARLEKGKLHELELYITDNKDNVARWKSSFFY